MKKIVFLFIMGCIFVLVSGIVCGQTQKETINLLSLQEGTLPVVEPASYGGWPVVALLDDSPDSGRAQNRRVEMVRQ